MAEPQPVKRDRAKAYFLKLPMGPSANATLLVVSFLPRVDLSEQNPTSNAHVLCNHLMILLDRSELIELKKELVKLFP